MKVRISGNSIRFRLRQPEVATFGEIGKIEEITEFGPESNDRLSFCLMIHQEANLSVSYKTNSITIGVPKHTAAEWTNTASVGFSGTIDTGKGRRIDILVEKDFVCLDRPEEENLGAYPNPNTVC